MRRSQDVARAWFSVGLSLSLIGAAVPAKAASALVGTPVVSAEVPAARLALTVQGPETALGAAAAALPAAPGLLGAVYAAVPGLPSPAARAAAPARPASPAAAAQESLAAASRQLPSLSGEDSVHAVVSAAALFFDGSKGRPSAAFGAAGGGGAAGSGGGSDNAGPKTGLPADAAVIPLPEHVLFVGRRLSFTTTHKATSRLLIDASQGLNEGYILFVSAAKEGTAQGHHRIATLARVRGNVRSDKGRYTAVVDTVAEAVITGYRTAEEQRLYAALAYPGLDRADEALESFALTAARTALAKLAVETGELPAAFVASASQVADPVEFVNAVSHEMPFSVETKQAILSERSVVGRLDIVAQAFNEMRVGAASRRGKQSAQQPAGEDDPAAEDEEDAENLAASLKAKVEASGMSKEAKTVALREVKKLASLNPQNSDFSVTLNYVRTLLELPWAKKTSDNFDLPAARRILDRDHAGLDKVKQRVLEYLAVRKKAGSLKGPILCFVGPPGTGKTSIAKDIAEALGRKYVRFPLGGVHNEAEIRGHRRTYVGAIPGKIMTLMKRAGTMNPLFLLDEIDKVSNGQSASGDPAAALLEVLDPEQNYAFNDHYLDVPFDLSEVMFVTTANSLETIPEALRDRMEIIEFSSYTTDEKMAILEKHALPEKAQEAGFKPGAIRLNPAAQRRLIEGHTRESGVRKLRRTLEELLRKIVWKEEEKQPVPAELGPEDIDDLLGHAPYENRETQPNGVGVATGLAVGHGGGSTLAITALAVPGTGRLQLRKQMREMLDDSANNAYAYILSLKDKLGIPLSAFKEQDLHIAFAPAGPVDGPSAGAAMATAIASRLSGRPVKTGVAMTGELTLTGRVKAIGGLKEKILAAHRSGMHTVLFPAENLQDLEELPAEVKKAMRLVAVTTLDEVFAEALDSSGRSVRPESGVPAPAGGGAKPAGFWAWVRGLLSRLTGPR